MRISDDTAVIEATNSKFRTFLYELAEGTSNYRSLHSLTEQVEHQYHGRFIVELIQNAHDALLSTVVDSTQLARIEITLKEDSEFGTLYVANDGKPFSASNFNSLSQLGQSDKNPQESIGNKGIGFRSVLEITNAPEIYSRSTSSSKSFDGFCFAFSPEVISRMTDPVLVLLSGDDNVFSPFGNVCLVDWDVHLLTKFRTSVEKNAAKEKMLAEDWLKRELKYLSPYLLPFPIGNRVSDTFVTEFESRGFATLIRFPLKNEATQVLVREKLDKLNNSALLFLEKVTSLVLDTGNHRRELHRHQVTHSNSLLNGREVSISEGNNNLVDRYWVWGRDIALINTPENIQTAIQQLPGKWSQLQDTSVSIAVKIGDTPEQGMLSIFLPTLLLTGSATHINAPFFGDMSRTLIDFNNAYNQFLFNEAATLAVKVAVNELAEKGIEEAQAIIDLLSPWSNTGQSESIWIETIKRVCEKLDVSLQSDSLFLADSGWASLKDTALLPAQTKTPFVLTQDILRTYATFNVFNKNMDGRKPQLMALAKHFDSGIFPLPKCLADTLEAIAVHHHSELGDYNWSGFWIDAGNLFNGDCRPLVGKCVLLGNDGQLHAGGSNTCTIFFIPRQGVSEDEEVENDGDIKDIPSTLQPFIAFLSEHIQVYEERNGRLQQTQIRKLLLDSKLVSSFRREDILNNVLIPKIPRLPVLRRSSDETLCRDILLWSLRLMAEKGEKSLRLLKNLPAPCRGGWYPLIESAFGSGWSGTSGDATQNYLSRIKTTETLEASKRLLLHPDNKWWSGNGNAHINLLRRIGVFDGLKLIPIDPKSWNSSPFKASKFYFQLPETHPLGWSENDWNEYRSFVRGNARPIYNEGNYEIQQFYTLPGLNKYQEFDESARMVLMKVVFNSIRHWEYGWDTLSINRIAGNWDSIKLLSPLAYSLSKLPWLGLSEDDNSIEWYRPADRWHIPNHYLLGGQKWKFAHLKPLPFELALRLDTDNHLAEVMRKLGTPRFDPETKSDNTQLLDALTEAVIKNEVPHWDVFLGQVRSAWRGFEPAFFGSSFPNRLLVHKGSGSKLTVEIPNKENPVYLPDDSTKSFLIAALKHFELPIIAIETNDAKRLANQFTTAYFGNVIRASTLEPMPLVDGKPWNEIAQNRLCDNTDLEWTIPVLLTIAAFHGEQSQGTTSESFRKQLETFRNARLSIVEKIETGLFRNNTQVVPPLPVPALWLKDSQTLILNNGWQSNIASLSEVLSNLLGRESLEMPIQLMLTMTGSQPEEQKIISSLEKLKLSEGHFRDVKEHWRGDLSQIIERLMPVLVLLKFDSKIGELGGFDTDDAVVKLFNQLDDIRIDGENLVSMARDSSDMFDFGSKIFLELGEDFQLSNWNDALSHLNKPALVNIDASTTFNMHLSVSAQVLRSLLAFIVINNPGIRTFSSLNEQLTSLVCPEEFKTDYWDVSFTQTISTVIPLFKQFLTPEQIASIQQAASIEDLTNSLDAAGIDVKFDPIQTDRDNREKLQRALQRLQQIGLAWALESSYPNPSDWESRIDNYLKVLSNNINAIAFSHVWNDKDILDLLKKLPVDTASTAFWHKVAVASSIDDLIIQLGLSEDALSEAKTKLEVLREKARQRKKIIEICGKEFDSTEDNLSTLWTHICSGLPDADISKLEAVNIDKVSSLEDITASKRSKRKEVEPINKSNPKHLSKSMENLIGLSGEIHAFRRLQNIYGTSVVSSSSWISGNSNIVFKGNKTDDSKGCDFIVVLKNRTYYIEVKSSEGSNESFTLGSSEIRLAMELVKKSGRKHKGIFLMLRVSNALSTTPSFQLLPNPYDPKYQSCFVIEEADARIRYRSKNSDRS